MKRPQTFEGQFRHPPLLVLNNFKQTQEEKKEENEKEKSEFKVDPKKLCATMLQNMFPAINIQKYGSESHFMLGCYAKLADFLYSE